jgi:signal transduction histidine kinase
VNIYRIVQESLNNIIKHAHAGASRVSVKKLANEVIILVKDNGKGFDFSQRFQDVKSLGLKTLLERTKVLNGQMKVQSKIDMGTSIEFQIPLR